MLAETLDLSFKPVGTVAPKRLSADQIAFYNQEGYITPLDVFSPAEAEDNRAYFDRLLDQVADRGAYSINCYQARCRGIWDLCTEPRLLDLVQDLIGPNIVCWASHFFCKMPHDDKLVPWHQDASYWKLSPARTVTIWQAIDDADENNSAMRFIPRTHNQGHLDRLEIDKGERASVLHLETAGADRMGEPISNNLKAGQASLHADMLVHGSRPNLSDRRRCGLTIRYCPPEVGFVDDKWAKSVEAIICRGTDTTGNWHHHARPQNDDISNDKGPLNIGGN
jgi:hypothetical protein